jgi:hypothetical protein
MLAPRSGWHHNVPMSFRFFRRKKLFPGVSLNLSKSGASLSFGPRGAKVTVGPRGVRKTVGLPGTGAYWTEHSGYGARKGNGRSRKSTPPPPPTPQARPQDRLSLSFFDRLFTPKKEEHFVDGMKRFIQGDTAAALRHFETATELADAAFMAGLISLKHEQFDAAEHFLMNARSKQLLLGHYFDKYGVQAMVALPITEEIAAIIGADQRGVLLALAEVHQHQGHPKKAIAHLRQLYQQDSEDVVVRLALAELLVEEGGSKRNCQTVVRLAEGIENDSEIHGGLLLYKAKALRLLGLQTAARETLTNTLRRKKNRSDDLLRALRYERALVYEQLGWDKRYRKALERLYAESPEHEDVAGRLGLDADHSAATKPTL